VPKEEEEKGLLRQLLEASSVGIHLVLTTFAGFAIGYVLDKKVFGTFPGMTIIFLILGVIAGFKELFRVARKQDGADKKSH
jgi:ATP synthase protein I